MNKKAIVFCFFLITSLLISGCGPDQPFGSIITPTLTFTPTPIPPTTTPTPVPMPEIKTSTGIFVIEKYELSDRFPSGCTPSPMCYVAPEGRQILNVWLKETGGDYTGDLFKEAEGAFIIGDDNSRTYLIAGGFWQGRYFVAFSPLVSAKSFFLMWHGNPPIGLEKTNPTVSDKSTVPSNPTFTIDETGFQINGTSIPLEAKIQDITTILGEPSRMMVDEYINTKLPIKFVFDDLGITLSTKLDSDLIYALDFYSMDMSKYQKYSPHQLFNQTLIVGGKTFPLYKPVNDLLLALPELSDFREGSLKVTYGELGLYVYYIRDTGQVHEIVIMFPIQNTLK